TGYGRVVRDAEGHVAAIVEHRDADLGQRAIRSINTGNLSADTARLRHWLSRIGRDNVQGESYLTDIFALAATEGAAAQIVACNDPQEVEGANDLWQLAALERAFQQRAVRALCQAGARVADPARIDIRGEVTVGHDVALDVDVILEGRVVLGD